LTIFSIWLKYWSIRGYSRTQRRGWWRTHQFNIKDWLHEPLSITACFSEKILIIKRDRSHLLCQWCWIIDLLVYCTHYLGHMGSHLKSKNNVLRQSTA